MKIQHIQFLNRSIKWRFTIQNGFTADPAALIAAFSPSVLLGWVWLDTRNPTVVAQILKTSIHIHGGSWRPDSSLTPCEALTLLNLLCFWKPRSDMLLMQLFWSHFFFHLTFHHMLWCSTLNSETSQRRPSVTLFMEGISDRQSSPWSRSRVLKHRYTVFILYKWYFAQTQNQIF